MLENIMNKSPHLKKQPVSEAKPGDFEVREGPVPDLGPLEILVQSKCTAAKTSGRP